MNKRIVLDNLGGFPLEQDTLAFMQDSYRGALAAMANLCGDKSILYGVEVVAGNVTNGWISVNGELIPFIGGPVADDVVITETPAPTQAVFEDSTPRDVYFTKVATVGAVGDFPFTDLVPLLAFQNMWLPGDLKQKYVDNAYIAANFDGDGYGINKEKGWRKLTSFDPDAAGRVLVNIDEADTDLDEAGKIIGAKTHTLNNEETGTLRWRARSDDGDSDTASFKSITVLEIGGESVDVSGLAANTYSAYKNSRLQNDAEAHNNMQKSMVVLTLIKL